jgi:hypothetical protein
MSLMGKEFITDQARPVIRPKTRFKVQQERPLFFLHRLALTNTHKQEVSFDSSSQVFAA